MKIYNFSIFILFEVFICAKAGIVENEVTKELATQDKKIPGGIATETAIKTNPTTSKSNPTTITTNSTTTATNPTTTTPNPTMTTTNPTTTTANLTAIKTNPKTTKTDSYFIDTPSTPPEGYYEENKGEAVGGTSIRKADAAKKDNSENIHNTDIIDRVGGEEGNKEADRKENTGNVTDVQQDETALVKLFEVAAITAGICLILLLVNFIQLVLVFRIFGTRQKEQTIITSPDVPQIVISKDGPSMQTLVEQENQNEAPSEVKSDQPESNPDKDKEPLNTDKDETSRGENKAPIDVKTESQKTSPVNAAEVNQAEGAKLNASDPLNDGADKPPADTTVIDLDDFPPPPDVADLNTEGKPNESEGETSLAATEDPSKTIASLEEEVKKLVEFADTDASSSI